MRKFIDIISEAQISPELFDEIQNWVAFYNKDDAHTGASNAQCDRIIALTKGHPVDYRGTLYRGTAIPDEAAKALQRGETVTIQPLAKKLASWSKDPHNAWIFADNARQDNFSAILIKIPAPRLSLILDFEAYYDADPNSMHESEVLAMNEPLRISPSELAGLWVYDDDEEESVEIFSNY